MVGKPAVRRDPLHFFRVQPRVSLKFLVTLWLRNLEREQEDVTGYGIPTSVFMPIPSVGPKISPANLAELDWRADSD